MKLDRINYYSVRTSMSVTQEEVAQVSGTSTATISRLENRSANVSYSKAHEVVSGLRVLGAQAPLLNPGRPMVPTHRIVSRLNRALDSLGMSQAMVADLVGVSPKTLNHYVTGYRKAPKTFINAFEAAFGINLLK